MKRKVSLLIAVIYILSLLAPTSLGLGNKKEKAERVKARELPIAGTMPQVRYTEQESVLEEESAPQEESGALPVEEEEQAAEPAALTASTIPEEILAEIHYGESGVNMATGNYARAEIDYVAHSPGHTLTFSRTYNHLDWDNEGKLFGNGWSFSFQGLLNLQTYNYAGVSTPDGGWQYFTISSGSYNALWNTSALAETSEGYVLTTQDQYQYVYCEPEDQYSYGYLIKIRDPYGNTITINRPSNNKQQISSIVDSAGRTYTFSYLTNNRVSKITLPDGGEIQYTYPTAYADQNFLTGVSGATNNAHSYTYQLDQADQSSGIKYLHEVKDTEGNILSSFTAYGWKYLLDEYGNQRVYQQSSSVAVDSNGYTVKREYNTDGYVKRIRDPLYRETEIGYHSKFKGIQTSVTDVYGNQYQMQLDSMGNVSARTDPNGKTAYFEYDSLGNLTEETDENGNKTYYYYSGKSLLKKVVPLDGVSEYTESSEPENFAITEYAYYTDAELAAMGVTGKGLLRAEREPGGRVVVYGYDSYGNTTTVKELAAPPANLEEASISGEGAAVTRTYDTAGRMTSSTNPVGITTVYEYDSRGNLVKQTVNGTDVTAYTYDAYGRVLSEVAPKDYTGAATDPATRYTYYPHGKVKTKTDTSGNTTTYTYDLYGNLTAETQPDGVVYEYQYDPINRLTHKIIKDPATGERRGLEHYKYDLIPTSEETQALAAGGNYRKTEKYYYDGLSTQITPEKEITDKLRRVVRKIDGLGYSSDTEYYPNGLVKKETDAEGYRTVNAYNGLGLLSEQWSEAGVQGSSNTPAYTYRKLEYDAAGRVRKEHKSTELVPIANNSDPVNSTRPAASTYITTENTYNADGTLSMTQVLGGGKSTFAYDANGRMTSRDDYVTDSEKITTSYTYNHQDKPLTKTQVISNEDIAGGGSGESTSLITSYEYDESGNLVKTTNPDGSRSSNTYDSENRILYTQVLGQNEYGANVTITGWNTYRWDGKLATSAGANGTVTEYGYDKMGNEVKRDEGGLVTVKEYDLRGRLRRQVEPVDYQANKAITEMNRTEYEYDAANRMILQKYVYVENGAWKEQVVRACACDEKGESGQGAERGAVQRGGRRKPRGEACERSRKGIHV